MLPDVISSWVEDEGPLSNYPLDAHPNHFHSLRVRHIKRHPKTITLEWKWFIKTPHSEWETTCLPKMQRRIIKHVDMKPWLRKGGTVAVSAGEGKSRPKPQHCPTS